MGRYRSRSRESRRGGGGYGGGGGGGYGGGGGGGTLRGTACRWNERGFGFIKPDDGGEDLFCHVSAIKDGNCLQEGAQVTYEASYDDRKGKYRAENVYGGCDDPRP